MYTSLEPVKDESGAHPVPVAWRPTLVNIVEALSEGDYEISRGIALVAPVRRETANLMRSNIEDYGERLVMLPEKTWTSSVCQWMATHWEVLVDLWTIESGRSDLALFVNVYESDAGFRFEVDSLHVP